MNSKIVQKHHHPHIIHHLPSTTNHHTWPKVGILPSIPKSFKAYHLPRSFRLGLDESRFKEASVSITKATVFEKTDIRQQRQVVESWNELLKVGTQTVSWFFAVQGTRVWISESVEHEEIKAHQVHEANVVFLFSTVLDSSIMSLNL